LGGGLKHEGVDELLILKSQWAKQCGQGEDPVVIANRKQIVTLLFEPEFALAAVAIRAVAVSAAVGRPMEVGAGVALDERPAQLTRVTAA